MNIFLNTKSNKIQYWVHWVMFLLNMTRSSHRRCSVRKGVPRNFAKFTGKHLCQSLFFNKVYYNFIKRTLLKRKLWQRCFHVDFVKFLRTPSLQNTSGRLLLYYYHFLTQKNSFFVTYFILRFLCHLSKSKSTPVIFKYNGPSIYYTSNLLSITQ